MLGVRIRDLGELRRVPPDCRKLRFIGLDQVLILINMRLELDPGGLRRVYVSGNYGTGDATDLGNIQSQERNSTTEKGRD